MFRAIDPHVHAETLTFERLKSMSKAGIIAVIGCSYYPHLVKVTTQKYLDFFDALLTFYAWLIETHNIKLYIAVGINMLSVPADYNRFLKIIPTYLKKEKVVAIGEVGMDPRSLTDLKTQEIIFRQELDIAKKHGVPVIVHTPPERVDKKSVPAGLEKEVELNIIDKYISMIEEVKLDKKTVVIDHLSSESDVKRVLDFGCYAGLSVRPWSIVTPKYVARIAMHIGPDKLLINSDSGYLETDCLSVPKTVAKMRALGMKEKDIEKIVFENPVELFNLKIE